MSSFSGISSALSALQAQRKAMEVTGQNIANVNTPGYTRQRAELREVVNNGAVSLYAKTTTVGNGVEVATISRASDALLAARVDSQTADHALLSGRASTLSSVEGLTLEPGENGLSARLSEMWASWSDVALHPDNAASRTVVLQRTQTVVDTLRTGRTDVDALYAQQLGQSQADVAEVNSAAATVADLNSRIQKAVVTGGSANELMDQRDTLVTRLSELTGSTAQAGPNGQVDVLLGGSALVQGNRAGTLVLTAPAALPVDGSSPAVSLRFADGSTASPASGALAAGVEAMTRTLPTAAATYDAIASELATRVNAQQALGVTYAADGTTTTPGGPVFAFASGTSKAQGLQMVLTSGSQLAAGTPGKGASDGSNAAAVAAVGGQAGGPDALWKARVAVLGSQSASATQRATAAQQVLTSSVTDQQGATGVSLDEETANLIAQQRAYEGAARVLTAIDEALDTLINRTGLVGR